MAERQVFVVRKCVVCQDFIEQAAKGRPRLTCSDACRQARYRFGKGKSSRRNKRIEKSMRKRRAMPFGERNFSEHYHEPIRELSYRRWIYECLACGQPYLVERIKSGTKASSYCSEACQEKAAYHWRIFEDALAKASMSGPRTDERVLERYSFGKLSPLCPHCKRPFAPNTNLYGYKQRGRPRKFCSDRCRKAAYEKRWKQRHHGNARGHRYGECLDCGKRIDKVNRAGVRFRRFCDDRCANRFTQRAFRARLKMKAKGQVKFLGRRGGYGIASKLARKNRKRDVESQDPFCNRIEELASGRSGEGACLEVV